ncbi:MAG: tRNA-dihydrouridine synthase [Planctomycetota bacterium]
MLKIGSISLDVPFMQAPMSGYTDPAMRAMARRFGCPLTCSGVMLAGSVLHQKIFKMPAFRVSDDDHPICGQILGTEPHEMASAAKVLTEVGYDLVDLNFACPAPKVINKGRGGSLLKSPEMAIEIYSRVRQAVSCPVIMKLRFGFDSSEESRENFWKIVEQACLHGIDAVVIHGRTVKQYYRGRADWDIITEVKRRFSRTVIIGSGDMFEPQEIVALLRRSGMDAAAIARGAIGNPWIFRDIRKVLKNNILLPPPDIVEQGQVILAHFAMVCRIFEVKKAVTYFRKFIVKYTKLHPNRRAVCERLLAVQNADELYSTIREHYGID